MAMMNFGAPYCVRCNVYFDSLAAFAHHQQTSLSHWPCQPVQRLDGACVFDAPDWLALCRHWNETNCFHFCPHCGLSWLDYSQLYQHLRIAHGFRTPDPLISSTASRPFIPRPRPKIRLTAPSAQSPVSGSVPAVAVEGDSEMPARPSPQSATQDTLPTLLTGQQPMRRQVYSNDELLRIRRQLKPSKRHFPILDALWEAPSERVGRPEHSMAQLDQELSQVKALLAEDNQQDVSQMDQFKRLLELRANERLGRSTQSRPTPQHPPERPPAQKSPNRSNPRLHIHKILNENAHGNRPPGLRDVTNARLARSTSDRAADSPRPEKEQPPKAPPKPIPPADALNVQPWRSIADSKHIESPKRGKSSKASPTCSPASTLALPHADHQSGGNPPPKPDTGLSEDNPEENKAQSAWEEEKIKHNLTKTTRHTLTPTAFQASLKAWAEGKTAAQLRQFMADEFDSLSLLDQPPRQVRYWVAAENAMVELMPRAIQGDMDRISRVIFGDGHLVSPRGTATPAVAQSPAVGDSPLAQMHRPERAGSAKPDDDEGEAEDESQVEYPARRPGKFFEW